MANNLLKPKQGNPGIPPGAEINSHGQYWWLLPAVLLGGLLLATRLKKS